MIKHCDDGETQIETPEEGAEFEVYLKSAGSYADAKETERDKTDIPVGAKLYVKEIAADEHYLISDDKYLVEFVYAGQDIAVLEIQVNDGEAIKNDLIYGNIKGLKIDREIEEPIAGALFGLFRSDETEFTEETAVLTAESQPDGVFT